MPRSSTAPAEAVSEERLSELQDSVQSLAYHVEVLREAVDEIREHLSWALRNLERFSDLPMQSLLKSMAADPTAPDWAQRLTLQTHPSEKPQPLSEEAMDQMEQRITHIAEGQLELILSALDDLRVQLLSAVSGKSPRKKTSGVLPSAEPAATGDHRAPEPGGSITDDMPGPPAPPAPLVADESGVSDPASAPSPPGQQKSLWV